MLFILCILYLKKQETFQNFNRNAFNYNGLVNYNFEPYIYKEETISELHIIVENILEEINKKTNSNLKLGNSFQFVNMEFKLTLHTLQLPLTTGCKKVFSSRHPFSRGVRSPGRRRQQVFTDQFQFQPENTTLFESAAADLLIFCRRTSHSILQLLF